MAGEIGSDGYVDVHGLPWQLIIRARTIAEIDAIVASVVAERLVPLAAARTSKALLEAVAQSRGAAGDGAGASQAEVAVTALTAIADFDDWYCGNGRPHPGPPHLARITDRFDHPLLDQVVAGAIELVRTAGSEGLQKTLGQALVEIGAERG